jgi:hypothetical protein
MTEYDTLIERAASQLAAWIKDSTEERNGRLQETILAATRLRSGLGDDFVLRQDIVGVWQDVIGYFRSEVKARTLKAIATKFSQAEIDEIKRGLDIEMAKIVPPQVLERIVRAGK